MSPPTSVQYTLHDPTESASPTRSDAHETHFIRNSHILTIWVRTT